MAGDWMKIELELPDKPEVHAISNALSIDSDAVVGKLIRVWQWFDKHTTDGNAAGVTFALVDRITCVTGFGEAMMFAGWLIQHDNTLTMPKFDRHTGESAKKRALTAKRVAKSKSNSNANSVTEALPFALPREEKRREENKDMSQEVALAKKPKETLIPKDFSLSDGVKEWALKNGHSKLDERLNNFSLTCEAKGYKYANWDSAFKRAISDDWAKLGKSGGGKPFDMNEFMKKANGL